MNRLFAAFIAGAFAFASVSAMADDKSPAAPVDQAKLKAERDAARAKWAAMSADEKAATRKATASKKVSELNALEQVAQEGEGTPMGDTAADKAAQAKSKAERDAAKAKWDKMTAEEKAATRKAAQAKKVSELTMLEKMSVGQ